MNNLKNFRIYVRISGPTSNFRTFQDKFQNFRNFRTTPRPADRQLERDKLTTDSGRNMQHIVTVTY